MLAEERFSRILNIIDSMGSATVQQLMDELDASESTVRRDLVAMDKKGYLTKVHGGAISNNSNIHTQDENFTSRQMVNHDEKEAIAKYAASLIKNHDFVYIDAGTTTELMINYIEAQDAVFVTNSLTNAKKLSERGYTVYILGGEFKSITEAIVGDEAVFALDKYNFTKGFWGANGINVKNGFTTPEIKEAMVKKNIFSQMRVSFHRYPALNSENLKMQLLLQTKSVTKTIKNTRILRRSENDLYSNI